MRIGI